MPRGTIQGPLPEYGDDVSCSVCGSIFTYRPRDTDEYDVTPVVCGDCTEAYHDLYTATVMDFPTEVPPELAAELLATIESMDEFAVTDNLECAVGNDDERWVYRVAEVEPDNPLLDD